MRYPILLINIFDVPIMSTTHSILSVPWALPFKGLPKSAYKKR